MIAKQDLLQSLQEILSLQQDLAPLYRHLADWRPSGDVQLSELSEFAAACRTLERDTVRQADCIENLCSSIARADRNDY
ncbi:MAG: hypothetical protein FIA97_19530 [Methylococcaceae bacterium]|nr:hypothetical protein [Methylococcaceae bacterium]